MVRSSAAHPEAIGSAPEHQSLTGRSLRFSRRRCSDRRSSGEHRSDLLGHGTSPLARASCEARRHHLERSMRRRPGPHQALWTHQQHRVERRPECPAGRAITLFERANRSENSLPTSDQSFEPSLEHDVPVDVLFRASDGSHPSGSAALRVMCLPALIPTAPAARGPAWEMWRRKTHRRAQHQRRIGSLAGCLSTGRRISVIS